MLANPRTLLPLVPGQLLNFEDSLVPHTVGYHNIALSGLYRPFSVSLLC